MSYVALGLFILACGWNVYRDYTPTRTRAIRIEGHPQYFGAALAAGYVFALAMCLHHAASTNARYVTAIKSIASMSPREESKADQSSAEAKPSALIVQELHVRGSFGPLVMEAPAGKLGAVGGSPKEDEFAKAIAIALWSGLLAFVLPTLLNAPFWANRRLSHLTTYDSLEAVERMLVDAVERGVSVAITLTNNKFYIGLPLETDQDSSADTKWIRMFPLASGYRTDHGGFQFTTAYVAVYDELLSDDDESRGPDDFRVGLPVSQILWIQNFDLDLYTRRFAEEATSNDPALSKALHDVIEGEDSAPAREMPWWAGEGDGVTLPDAEGLSVANASLNATLGSIELSATGTVGGARPDEDEDHLTQARHLPDWALLALRWAFHLTTTFAIAALAYSPRLSAIALGAAVFALALLLAPPAGRVSDLDPPWWGHA